MQPSLLEGYGQRLGAQLRDSDVQQGLAEWRSIQDVVQLTFKAFFETLKTQGEAIKSLEKSRDELAASLRNELTSAVQRKANGPEVNARLAELEQQLVHKADGTDVERRALRTELEASLRTQMADVMALLKSKSDEAEHKTWRDACDRQISALRADVARLARGLEEVKAAVATKAGANEVATALSAKADAADVDAKLREKASKKVVAEALASKADVASVDTVVADLRACLADTEVAVGRKADTARVEELHHRHERLRQRVEADSDTASAALRSLSTAMDDAVGGVARRAEAAAGAAAAAHAASGAVEEALRAEVHARVGELEERHGAALARKAEASEVARLLAETRGELAGVRDAMSSRASTAALAALEAQMAGVAALSTKLEALQKDVARKMGADRGVFGALDGKANVEDVNRALLEVCQELEKRAPAAALDALQARTESLAGAVTAAAPLEGRWLWKSGRTKAGGVVPWDVQATNSSPGSLQWEPGRTFVTAAVPGLYQLSFGFFFAGRRPIVQVLVNGEPVLTATGPSGHVHHSSAAASLAGAAQAQIMASEGGAGPGAGPHSQHSAGSITGLTGSEFVSLPGEARVAVVYQGAGVERCEGFLMLRKL